jgi:hypothetical protein
MSSQARFIFNCDEAIRFFTCIECLLLLCSKTRKLGLFILLPKFIRGKLCGSKNHDSFMIKNVYLLNICFSLGMVALMLSYSRF